MKDAEYKCARCSHEWHLPLIGKDGKNPMDGCSACGNLYAQWTNYERDFA